MKEIVGYLTWTWRNWELWQKLFIVAMIVQVIGWFIPGTAGMIVSGMGFSVIVYFILKWFVWDRIAENWSKYKSHRNELLTTIKESDK